MERPGLTEEAGGGVGEMVASRGQRGEGVLAQGTTHVELLQETGLSENLQRQADEWVAELEDTQQHMQQIVGALASVAQAGSVVDWGGSTMTTWLEDKYRQLSTILWQILEDPAPELFLDWQLAGTLITNCNMIFSQGVDYYDQLKERLSIETSTIGITVSTTVTARTTMISATATSINDINHNSACDDAICSGVDYINNITNGDFINHQHDSVDLTTCICSSVSYVSTITDISNECVVSNNGNKVCGRNYSQDCWLQQQ
ncbi:hypothetical protein CBR_g35029 [Chara braunii]|uniref:Uncharacterized protein n=1 Tax=Chara braunii TaxID=69332 RepID=A0A388LKA8_CHABU|nr:hypothetical protein CBR_g35029 [Chara braunii]|eukprot:GBG82663.1 hypothetical protein CBR_g35029 [Chara braunii]